MSDTKSSVAVSGVTLGQVIAVTISWGLNHSIGWAVWHGILGWGYVVYRWVIGY